MKTKIKRLDAKQCNAALELYAESCHNDRFFCKLFKTDDCYADIKKYFYTDVWTTIQVGNAYGAFAGKQLVGVLLGFDLQHWYNSYRKEFDHVFNFDNDEASYWFETVDTYFRTLDKRILYVYAICVDEQFRRKGVASMMIKELCSQFERNYSIVSDATNPVAMSMWFKNRFKEVRLGSKDKEVVLLAREVQDGKR